MLLALVSLAQAADLEPGVRLRFMSVPDAFLDAWFTDNDMDGSFSYKRPTVRALSVGGEFVFVPGDSNLVGYIEYIGNKMPAGYWDDNDGTPQNWDDGDWIEPENFGIVAVGANALHEVVLTDSGDVVPSVLFGGGLGVGFATGELVNWQHGTNPDNADPTCLPAAPSFERKDVCDPDGVKRVPGVVPMLDLVLGAQATVKDRVVVRLEGGMHTMLFWGFSVGGSF